MKHEILSRPNSCEHLPIQGLQIGHLYIYIYIYIHIYVYIYIYIYVKNLKIISKNSFAQLLKLVFTLTPSQRFVK